MGEGELNAVLDVLRSGRLVQGDVVEAFERAVAARVGTRHAVAVASGTASLHLALLATGIGPGDEVVVPAFTFPAAANVVCLTGAIPVLADIETTTLNAGPAAILRVAGSRTRAVMPTHLFGLPTDVQPLVDSGLVVIEDAACALGGKSLTGSGMCGALGKVGCFSFHPRKIATTGEGGVLTTDDDDVADAARRLRNHGMVRLDGRVQFQSPGFNYRMSEIHAAIGLVQMSRLDALLVRRATLAALYSQALAGVSDLILPRSVSGRVWQAYVVLLPDRCDRDQILAEMAGRGVECALGTYALDVQPAYAGALPQPNARAAFRRSLALPLHTNLSDSDALFAAEALVEVICRCR